MDNINIKLFLGVVQLKIEYIRITISLFCSWIGGLEC